MDALLAHLLAYRSPGSFNFYAQSDDRFDMSGAAALRVNNLTRYLNEQRGACLALIGEAAGYHGCRFTGIPFTCEAQLRQWGDQPYRTSSHRGDHDERSARVVWQTLTTLVPRAIQTHSQIKGVILWNAFPWHPHQPRQPMSNRTPNAAERRAGCEALALFLEHIQPQHVLAVGRVAERALAQLGVTATYARHPSHGGQTAFGHALHSFWDDMGGGQAG